MLDGTSGEPRMPGGAVGHRWGSAAGKWNLKLEDAATGEPVDPVLSLLGRHQETALVEFEQYDSGNVGAARRARRQAARTPTAARSGSRRSSTC